MAAVTLSYCAAASTAAAVAHRGSGETVGSVGVKVASFAGLRSVAATMVAAPAVRGADVEFQTETFKKEKITLAGRDEVSSVAFWVNGI
jgi:hypothetical protein